jgi:hypothetical protein
VNNWKTTVAGILSAFMGAVGPLTGFLAALQAMKPTPDYTLAIWGAGLTCAAGIARVWIGLIQSDAKPSVTSTVTIEAVTPATPPKL